TESVAQVFVDEVKKAKDARAMVLQHRKLIQQESNALETALHGTLDSAPIDLNADLSTDEITDRDGTQLWKADPAEVFGTDNPNAGNFVSHDLVNLTQVAQSAPYTFPFATKKADGTDFTTTLRLFSDDDMADLKQHGIDHFAGMINAKISRANDL